MAEEENLDLLRVEQIERGYKADTVLQSFVALSGFQRVEKSRLTVAMSTKILEIQRSLIPLIQEFGGLDNVDEALLAGGYRPTSELTQLDLSWLPESLRYKTK